MSDEKIWDEFWKPIVTNEDGTLNLEQVKKELLDFKLVMGMVSTVYDSITGGRFTKLLTNPEYIISAAEEHFKAMNDIDDEEIKEESDREIDRISKGFEQEIEDWKASNRILNVQLESFLKTQGEGVSIDSIRKGQAVVLCGSCNGEGYLPAIREE